jgi:hypothetical protein
VVHVKDRYPRMKPTYKDNISKTVENQGSPVKCAISPGELIHAYLVQEEQERDGMIVG